MSITEFNHLAESYMRVIARTALVGFASWALYWLLIDYTIQQFEYNDSLQHLQKSLTYISTITTILALSSWILAPKESDEINKSQ